MPDHKRPGRPPLDASGVRPAAVHLKLPANDYDRLDRIARESRQSIQDVIRREVKRLITDERGGTF